MDCEERGWALSVSDSESVSRSDGSNRSGWVRPMMLLASIVTVGYILVQYTEAAPRVGVAPAPLTASPQRFTAKRSACFSMILRPNFIYLVIFVIFQFWLSGQWHMFLWCDKLITQIYFWFTQTLRNKQIYSCSGASWTGILPVVRSRSVLCI